MFHKIHGQGLYEFMGDDFQIEDLTGFDLPMNMESFETEFFVDPTLNEKDGSTELESGSFTKFSQECPKCGFSFDSKETK